jgi:hypothetical protein
MPIFDGPGFDIRLETGHRPVDRENQETPYAR